MRVLWLMGSGQKSPPILLPCQYRKAPTFQENTSRAKTCRERKPGKPFACICSRRRCARSNAPSLLSAPRTRTAESHTLNHHRDTLDGISVVDVLNGKGDGFIIDGGGACSASHYATIPATTAGFVPRLHAGTSLPAGRRHTSAAPAEKGAGSGKHPYPCEWQTDTARKRLIA